MEKAEPSLLAQMRDQSDASVTVTDQAATGAIGFVRTKGDLMPGRTATDARTAASKTDAYLDKYASLFGARADELTQSRVATTPFGWTVSYNQSYKGVPVWAGQLKAHVADNGDLTAVTGFAAPDLSLDVTPRRTADQAAEAAVAIVKAEAPEGEDGRSADTSGLRAVTKDLVVYRKGLVKGEQGEDVLAYDLEVSNITEDSGTIRDRVVLDANTLKVINRYSMMTDALDRTLYTTNYDPDDPAHDGTAPGEVAYDDIWYEGDPFPGKLDQDQQNLLESSAESYWMHMNTWGIDSYDDAGGERLTVHNRPDSCPNASWNGSYTSYCDGVYDDDTVAHEWGHAYTEYETGLIYQWQSGALNESYSDIWGETVDLLNNREDEGEGDLSVKRPDGLCSSHTRGAVTATIDAPSSVAGPCASAAAASFGPQFTPAGVTAEVVVATDAANADGPTTTDGCSTISNAAAVANKWAYVDRGTCPFALKIKNVRAAGADGIVFGNTGPGALSVSGNYPDTYGVMVSQADGTRIKSVGTVTMTVKELPRDTVDSYRWLLSEKSSAFGGAIRDMWNPTCYGDPGKVSDAEYYCTSDDNGGVHGNSGVPNHGYALLVDGGTYNGQTISGLGFDKAANIYFYAQNYMGPTSDFVDHADSLEQACADLTGEPIKELSLSEDADPADADPITAADCAQVAKMVTAIELRKDPTVQCAWKPLLTKGEGPALCGEGFTSRVLFSDDFNAGMDAWTKQQNAVYDGADRFPWRTAAVYPGRDNVGRVAYGPAPDEGDCDANDISAVDSMTSPSVLMPAGKALRLSFDHYVATEAGYDGGNVKISVNGGSFTPIAKAAYVFNAPNTTITVPQNTNPMKGQPAFSGTNPGRASGSWGTSQVNLEAAGAKAGDTIQIRFDIGRDGCGGVDGWYVDDVSISVCEATNTKVTAVHTPEPVTFGEPSKVDVTVAADKGGVPSGAVDLVKADGTKIASGTLAGGKVSLNLPTDLPVGTHVLTANYAGNGGFNASSGTVTVTVKAAPAGMAESTTVVKVKPAKPSYKENFRVVVRVKSDGATPTGKVVLRIDGKRMGIKRLKDGKVVFKIKRDYKSGKHIALAKYKGSDTVEHSKNRVRFRVAR